MITIAAIIIGWIVLSCILGVVVGRAMKRHMDTYYPEAPSVPVTGRDE